MNEVSSGASPRLASQSHGTLTALKHFAPAAVVRPAGGALDEGKLGTTEAGPTMPRSVIPRRLSATFRP